MDYLLIRFLMPGSSGWLWRRSGPSSLMGIWQLLVSSEELWGSTAREHGRHFKSLSVVNPYRWYSCWIWLDCSGGPCKQERGAGMRGTQKSLFEWLSDLSLVFTFRNTPHFLPWIPSHRATEQHPSWNYWGTCEGGMWFRQRCCVQLASWWSDFLLVLTYLPVRTSIFSDVHWPPLFFSINKSVKLFMHQKINQRSLSPIPCFLGCIEPLQSGSIFHYSTEAILIKVTGDILVAKVNVAFETSSFIFIP